MRNPHALVGLALLLGALGACGADARLPAGRLLEGQPIPFGAGRAHAWMALDREGAPVALGVAVEEAAFASAAGAAGRLRLELPRVGGLAFDHAELEFHPAGHAPEDVFGAPHLDVRFFLIDSLARMRLADTPEAACVPPLDGLPPPYVPLPHFRPGVGAYWIDPTAAPFDGRPLGGSIAYGFYDRHMVFVEVKLAAARLRERGGGTEPLALPKRLPAHGAFPTRWEAGLRRGALQVALLQLR